MYWPNKKVGNVLRSTRDSDRAIIGVVASIRWLGAAPISAVQEPFSERHDRVEPSFRPPALRVELTPRPSLDGQPSCPDTSTLDVPV